MADFKGICLTGVPKGSSPTYVKLRMTNLGKRTMNTASNDPAAPSAQSSAPGWTGI